MCENIRVPPLGFGPLGHQKYLAIFKSMQRSMEDMGMKKVNLCLDMHLYDMTKQVCWHQPRKFQNVEVHPGDTYIIVIFGCIGTLKTYAAISNAHLFRVCKRGKLSGSCLSTLIGFGSIQLPIFLCHIGVPTFSSQNN